MRQATSFVIPGHNKNRHSFIGNAHEWGEGLIRETWHHSRSVEDVAAVDNDVNGTI
jgi:hypothetical protein